MKKVLSCLLAVMLFLTCIPTAMAVDNARDFFFELSVDGSDKKEVQPGDIMVAGRNFGCGSSREHAPIAILGAGMPVVIGHSFARIFYRNAFNMGLLLMEVGDDVDKINDGDELEVDAATGVIRDLTNGAEIQCPPLPASMAAILAKGGLVNYVKERLAAKG